MNDPLIDIWQYSPTMTIRQVVTFFERKGMNITRAMVQNYIRYGLLPPPAGREYSHKHLAALVMIDRLKTVFDLDTVRMAMAPFMTHEGLGLDDYSALLAAGNALVKAWAAASDEQLKPGNATIVTMLSAAAVKESVAP